MNKPMMMVVMLVMLVLVLAGLYYAFIGVDMHNQVAGLEADFHALQADYWSNTKAVRDAAPEGSQLLADLVVLQQTPSTLLELKLVGVGRILTGIFAVLFAILLALLMMPVRLGSIMKKK